MSSPHPTSADERPFTRAHYLRLVIGLGILLVGFLLLASEKFVDATKFSVSLWIAPLVILGGYIWIGAAILYRPLRNRRNAA